MKSIAHIIVAGAGHGQNWEVKSEVNLVFAAKASSFVKGFLLNEFDLLAAPNIWHIQELPSNSLLAFVGRLGGNLMSLWSLVVSYLISTFKVCSRIFKDVREHPKQICCDLLQLGIPNESERAPRAALRGNHWSQTSEQKGWKMKPLRLAKRIKHLRNHRIVRFLFTGIQNTKSTGGNTSNTISEHFLKVCKVLWQNAWFHRGKHLEA